MATLAESPDFHLSKKLQPGDIGIVHDPTIFHSRGEVIDGEVSFAMLFLSTCFGCHVLPETQDLLLSSAITVNRPLYCSYPIC